MRPDTGCIKRQKICRMPVACGRKSALSLDGDGTFTVLRYYGAVKCRKDLGKAMSVILKEEFSPRKLILRSNVVYLATTDDPADSLCYHEKIAEDGSFPVRVTPTFRTDRIFSLCDAGKKLSRANTAAFLDT